MNITFDNIKSTQLYAEIKNREVMIGVCLFRLENISDKTSTEDALALIVNFRIKLKKIIIRSAEFLSTQDTDKRKKEVLKIRRLAVRILKKINMPMAS